MDLNFKDLSAGQELALRKLLSSCTYLAGSARWNVSEGVLRDVQASIENDYKLLEAATAVKNAAKPAVTVSDPRNSKSERGNTE